VIHWLRDERRRSPPRRSRPAQGNASGRAGGERTAAADHQGIAAASLWAPGRELARGAAPARAGGSRAARRGRRGRERGEAAGRTQGTGGAPPGQPRRLTGSSAAGRNGGRCREHDLPRLLRPVASDRRRCRRAARHRAGAIPRAGRAPAQIRLSPLRGGGGAGGRSGTSDRGRSSDRGDGRPSVGVEICRPSSPLPASPDLCPPGRHFGSFDTGRLGRTRGFPVAAGLWTAARSAEGLLEAVCRRNDGAGARSRSRTHKNRSALHLCSR
jgi:hypothetical protein